METEAAADAAADKVAVTILVKSRGEEIMEAGDRDLIRAEAERHRYVHKFPMVRVAEEVGDEIFC